MFWCVTLAAPCSLAGRWPAGLDKRMAERIWELCTHHLPSLM